MHYVYILRSEQGGGYYVGMTTKLDARLAYHNAGRVRSTKGRRPFQIIHSEEYATRTEAREREKYLKSYRGAKEKLEIIEKIV